jgi:hypothetical protein
LEETDMKHDESSQHDASKIVTDRRTFVRNTLLATAAVGVFSPTVARVAHAQSLSAVSCPDDGGIIIEEEGEFAAAAVVKRCRQVLIVVKGSCPSPYVNGSIWCMRCQGNEFGHCCEITCSHKVPDTDCEFILRALSSDCISPCTAPNAAAFKKPC